jgi:para-aminobenzoate synthetase component 1
MLNWANQFSILLLLDSNGYQDRYSRYECLLAAGAVESADGGFDALHEAYAASKDWWFGNICYDHKNALEKKLSSRHEAVLGFPEIYFFRPEIVCYIDTAQTTLTIESLTSAPDDIYAEIQHHTKVSPAPIPKLQFQQRIDKRQYLDTISTLRKHIVDGDCYEINFCNEGFCAGVDIDPATVYHELNKISPAPFAAFYSNNDKYMMCASPERYIRKEGGTILAQPIKGTARRDADVAKDAGIKEHLYLSVKDRAENVMIVDLMRNDLARCCKTASVKVDELFGIYSFPQVHQMISTIRGILKERVTFTDVLKYSFPMGSMTGAPKIKVMALIDRYEESRRELFSGTVGYISPGGDFDFNVVIRSLFYNTSSGYLAYQTGGAITYDSIPEHEWEEMRLKAWALERIFI